MSSSAPAQWAPTPAHLRAVVVAVVLAAVAVVAQRLDLALLAAPFGAAATYGVLRRPRAGTQATVGVDAATLAEGQATNVRITALGGAGGMVAVAVQADHWVELDPPGGARAVDISGSGSTELAITARPRRWGRHELRASAVVWTSPLGAFRAVTTPLPLVVAALPLADAFAAGGALPRPAGLVGLHRSRRHGEGAELAEVRPFRTGDRLRRVNWPVSSRMGTLHVTAAWSDRETEVALILDSEHDLGVSEGLDGRASSLDIAVRAAGAIADHYLRAGDRVSLVDLGSRVRSVPSGGGRVHLRRLLETLAGATPGVVRSDGPRRIRRVRAGSLVIALSPLLGGTGVAQIGQLLRQGHAVVVIDTLPDHAVDATTSWRALAWRVRLLERQVELDRLAELGAPVVRWRGRGTLDEVLRDITRMVTAPRLR